MDASKPTHCDSGYGDLDEVCRYREIERRSGDDERTREAEPRPCTREVRPPRENPQRRYECSSTRSEEACSEKEESPPSVATTELK
jgi:hypothetical protein